MNPSADMLAGTYRRSSAMRQYRIRVLLASFALAHPLLNAVFERTVIVNAGEEEGSSDDDDQAAAATGTAAGDTTPSAPKRVKQRDNDGVCRVTLERPSRRTMLDALSLVVQYAHRPPRFFFACGSECRILRSADRCRTWKLMAVSSGSIETDTAEGGSYTDDTSALLASLPPRARMIAASTLGGSRGAAGTGAAAAKSAKANAEDMDVDLLCIAVESSSGHVLCCGSKGTALYSIDRGQHFVALNVQNQLRAIVESTSSETSDRVASTSIRHAVILSPGHCLITLGRRIIALAFQLPSTTDITCSVLFTGGDDICMLHRVSGDRPSRSDAVVEVVASFSHRIAFLFFREPQDAVTCAEIVVAEHSFGSILCIEELPAAALSALAVSSPPQPLKAAVTARTRLSSVGGTDSTPFSYATETALAERSSCFDQCFRCLDDLPTQALPPVPIRGFAAYSTGGRIVPYDCTSVLWLWRRAEGDTQTLVTSASNVSYVPLVQHQSKREKCGLVVLGPLCQRWVRSGEHGVSVSDDFGANWTSPQLALLGKAVALDSDECAVFSTKPAVATLAPHDEQKSNSRGSKRPPKLSDQWRLQPLPRESRMTVLYDAAALV